MYTTSDTTSSSYIGSPSRNSVFHSLNILGGMSLQTRREISLYSCCAGVNNINHELREWIYERSYIWAALPTELSSQLRPLKEEFVGLIAQLVEHSTGIADAMGANPVHAVFLFFSGFNFTAI